MLLKCCTQCANKFGKLSSDHRTKKSQFSFQSQRKAMPKNVQTTAQLHSSHMLAKLCSKFSKPGFSSTWTMNFQMFKLDLEKAKEPEIILPTSVGSLKRQENSRKTSTSASLTMPKPLTAWITTNWKILQEMGIPDCLTCFLRNLYDGQEATVRTGNGTKDWFQIGKGVCQGCILSPCLFNLYAEPNMWNARLDETQVRIKIAGRIINNLRYADDTTLMAESKEEQKFLMNVKQDSEKAGLKLTMILVFWMLSASVTLWQIDRKTLTDFIFLGSKITAVGDCSHEIKRHLLLGRIAMTSLDSIL